MFIKNKKVVKVVILLLLVVPYFVSAQTTTDSFEGTFIGAYSFVDTKGHYGNFEHFTRISDGMTAYCIEPGVSLASGSYNGYYDLTLKEMADKVSLSLEQLNKVSLYAYFGYGYEGHTGVDWIVATQSLIWGETGRTFQFTSKYNPSDPYKYVIDTPSEIKSHMEEIKDLVNNYLANPFSSNTIKIPYSSYNLGKLNGFSVTKCENCTYSIGNDNLIVTPTSKNNGSINLKKEAKYWDTSFIVYASSQGQNVLVPGNIPSINANISFEVVRGKLNLKKYDQDNKSCKAGEGGSLRGSIYKLYKEDGTFISNLEIDENCSASIDDLELGTYYVKEEQSGLNYELDPNQYYFELNLQNPVKDLTVYDKIYLGQVELLKNDQDTNSCKPSSIYASLKGAVYGIYSKEGDLLQELVIGEDCKAKSRRNLLLGEYYIQEIKAPKGYKLDTKKYAFQVTKENADDVISIKVKDKIYKTELIINKNYLYFHDIKPEVGAIFEIYYKKNGKKVAVIEIEKNGFSNVVLPYGEYVLKQVGGQIGYHYVEDIFLTVDENTNQKTYLTLLNKPYRGTLEFYKLDAENGKFLSNVLVEVYNEKDELVYRGITDENGKIVVDGLAYGKYYIKEKKTLKGYNLDLIPHYFEIREDKEIVRVEMQNEREVKVPDTGKSSNGDVVYAFVLMILGMGFIFYGKDKIA